MIKFAKDTPAGIDKQIQILQTRLNEKLVDQWGISDVDYECYGRAYLMQNGEKVIPFVYTGDGKGEYLATFVDDRLAALSVFYTSGEADLENTPNGQEEINLLFFANYNKLSATGAKYNGYTQQIDENIHVDVLNAIDRSLAHRMQIKSIVKGFDNVFSDIDYDNGEALVDMHPFHVFRITLTCNYHYLQTC